MLILKALNEPSTAIYSSRKSIHYLSKYARDRAGVQAEQTLIIPEPDLPLPGVGPQTIFDISQLFEYNRHVKPS